MNDTKKFTKWCNEPIELQSQQLVLKEIKTKVVWQYPDFTKCLVLGKDGNNLFDKGTYLTFNQLYKFYKSFGKRKLKVINNDAKVILNTEYTFTKRYMLIKLFYNNSINYEVISETIDKVEFKVKSFELLQKVLLKLQK